MHVFLLLFQFAAERQAPVALPLGPFEVSAALVSVPRTLPGGEAADVSLRIYAMAMRGRAGACLAVAELEADDQDALGMPTTLGGVVEF